jgi:hypothetical protein
VAEEAADQEPAPAPETQEDDWVPPRELVAIGSALLALACGGAIFFGVPHKWTAPTLGALLCLGIAEGLVAIALLVRAALAGRRSQGQFVVAIVLSALAAIGLAGILLLSGVV